MKTTLVTHYRIKLPRQAPMLVRRDKPIKVRNAEIKRSITLFRRSGIEVVAIGCIAGTQKAA